MLALINGVYYREALGTTDWREAQKLERMRTAELQKKAPDLKKRTAAFASMDIATAITAYIENRKAQVSPRMVAYWKESASSLSKVIKVKLKAITPAHISAYQNTRLVQVKAPKTINGELSVLRQLLKHAKLWYRFDDYKPIRNTKPPVGRALTDEEMQRLFDVAQMREDWLYAYTAAVLGAFCGMRGCEIKGLQWKDVDLTGCILEIRQSKTPAGWRSPTLNTACCEALSALREKSIEAEAGGLTHYLFPSQKGGKLDPSRPAKSWRSAWRSMRHKAARNDEGEVIIQTSKASDSMI